MKCIVSDLDGTLLSMNKRISQNNLNAISQATSQGIEFMVATGREYQSVKHILDTHQLTADLVLMNGAQYRDKQGNIITSIPLAKQSWKAVYELADRFDLGAFFNFENKSFAFTGEEDFTTRLIRRFAHLPIEENKIVTELLTEGYWKSVVQVKDINELLAVGEEVLKMELFDFKDDNFDSVINELKQLPDLSIIPYGKHSIEITSSKAQKGIMLERVMALKGYELDEVMVLGDGLNDISMFKRFKHSFAMGNASEIVKAAANHETIGNEEDGVAHAIQTFVLQAK